MSTPEPKADWSDVLYFGLMAFFGLWCVGNILHTLWVLVTGVK